MKRIIFPIGFLITFSFAAFSQHEHHEPAKPAKDSAKQVKPVIKTDTSKKLIVPRGKDTIPVKTSGHDHHIPMIGMPAGHVQEHAHETNAMAHAFSRNLPMTRNGSGTAWVPDNSPMFGYMFHAQKWMYMVHGNTFLRYNKQDLFDRGSRGADKFDAPNMWMFMGQRNVGTKGLFRFSSMISLDPLTVGGNGYPLLFQTGETYEGQPLIDRQHPHDLFSELSVSYAHALSPQSDIFLYLGYPGEPALGPAAFVHRASGFMNPDAPLTHHWVDATHITFGVATLGYRIGNFKMEASSFTGREPDENRYDFDEPRFDSWSGRLSYNPTEKWAMQVSHGFIKEPELLHPGEDVNRTTASLQYSARGFGESFVNVTALWGMNKVKDHTGENGILLEGSQQQGRTAIYSRYEWVQKSVEELVLDETQFGHDAVFPIHAFTAGASYDIFTAGKTKFAIGGQFTFYSPDKRLTELYGDNPVAAQVYLRMYPRAMGTRDGKFRLPY
jgi:hypothetical protein